MKIILEKFSRITAITSSELADAIISNAKAGNVVVVDDDEE
jgi:type III secretion system FlhB-like substrate exporter